MKKYFVTLISVCLLMSSTFPQTTKPKPPFWDDVQTIKKYDNMFAPPARPLLFVGSSSIRKWDGAQWVFAKYNALNRGIGGAVTNDIIYYLNDLVFAYQPRQIVLYVGENDLMDNISTADSVYNRTVKLYHAIRAQMPDVPILYIGMKPSPSREKIRQAEIDANLKIKTFLANEKNTVFVDVMPLMLKDGKTQLELYLGDMLHMKKAGYSIWEKAIKKYLIKP
jgi:lysophospholipase L1-like esterase